MKAEIKMQSMNQNVHLVPVLFSCSEHGIGAEQMPCSEPRMIGVPPSQISNSDLKTVFARNAQSECVRVSESERACQMTVTCEDEVIWLELG